MLEKTTGWPCGGVVTQRIANSLSVANLFNKNKALRFPLIGTNALNRGRTPALIGTGRFANTPTDTPLIDGEQIGKRSHCASNQGGV